MLAFVRRENFDSNIFDVNFLIIAKNRYNLFSEIMYLKSYSSSKLPSIPILTFLSSMAIWMPAAVWKPISARRFLDSGQVFVGPVKNATYSPKPAPLICSIRPLTSKSIPSSSIRLT